MDEITRQKISLAIKKRWKNRDKLGLKGHIITDEHKQKLSDSINKKWKNGEYDRLIGCHLTEENKKNISIGVKKLWKNDNYKRIKIELAKKYWESQELREKYAILARTRWSNLEYKSKTIEAIQKNAKRPEYVRIMREHGIRRSEEISLMFKLLWQDKEWREHQVNRKISLETKQKISINSSKMWKNEEYREKGLERLLVYIKDPKRIDKLKTIMNTEDYRRRLSISITKVWQNKEYREKMAVIRLQQPKTSTQQKILYSLLDDLKIKYYNDQAKECRIGFYCFDCRIDPQEGIKLDKSLLIEVQGDYWHSLGKSIRNDKSKATYLKTYFPEYNLKYLWEHEFNNKDRVINSLKYWLGSNIEIKEFDFKNVNHKIIEASEAELFISKYHYAGRIGRSGVNLGYFLNGELIAVCIYSNPVRQEVALKQGYAYNQVLELSRLAIHPQYQIKNLASHLISKSINYIRKNRPEIKLLISFADATYNHDGTIYKASNWVLDGEVEPSYWYADNRGYICHKKTLWDKAKKMSMTENEYCDKYNYSKVWGDKKFRFIYKI